MDIWERAADGRYDRCGGRVRQWSSVRVGWEPHAEREAKTRLTRRQTEDLSLENADTHFLELVWEGLEDLKILYIPRAVKLIRG